MNNLFFNIPLAGYRNDSQWNQTCKRLRSTLRSILNSDNPDFNVVLCGHEKPELEEMLDPRIHFLVSRLEKPVNSSEFSRDKAKKRRQAMRWIRNKGSGDIFMMDADDHIHRSLVGYVRETNHPFGHVIRKGYAFDMARGNFAPVPGAWKSDFNRVCGSSHILRFKENDFEADGFFENVYGAHGNIETKSAAFGQPLNTIDWAAVVYVLGTNHTISATFGRTPDRQSQLRTSVEKHAVALTPELIKDFGLQPLIEEATHN
jgi:hypothetical protein